MTAHGFTAGPNVAESIDESGWGVRCHDGDLLGVGMLKGDAILYAAAPDLFSQHQWNKTIRDNVDELLAQAGFIPDSSVRHQLALMNFDGLASATGSRG